MLQHDASAQPKAGRQHLQEFYWTNQVKGLTLNINTSQDKDDNLIRYGGHRGMPVRRSHRFGQERQVDIEGLQAAVLEFIQTCDKKENLVMIGFGMAAEWEYLFTCFPQAMHFFSAWADLHDIAKDIAPVGKPPGLTSLLQLFRYHWKDVKPCRGDCGGGVADNAGDDAVATCALADDLLLFANQEKLRLRQQCGQIAGMFTKKKGFQVPDVGNPFTATIRTLPLRTLPPTLNSGIKVARRFFEYSPQSTGVMSGCMAFITFRSKDEMDRFINAVHGLPSPTGGTLSVWHYCPGETRRMYIEKREQRKKQDLREKERMETARREIEDLEMLFS
ncbi:hypothetical protein N0V84_011965 [Fusarium piperis]|uniref:Uncharacterized protein n=1 Tax=Fusarium piperis TaxID=1435070 RepID=A0A9W8TCJ5_9HYPO|nr:hypothetical protein N0V84_011965 [Fusarium piperis]